MRKARIAQLAGVAAAIPMLMLATTGSAYAAGSNVTWQDDATSQCLYWSNTDGWSVYADNCATSVGGSADTEHLTWVDDNSTSSLADNSNGQYYKEIPWADGPDECLTSYWQGSGATAPVYLEPCASPANYYEQWNEVKVNGGWNIVNRETGYCLDSSSGSVYALPCNGGKYQLWH